jgi:hypothetical protein
VPVGIVGTPSTVRSVSAAIERRAPGAFEFHAYRTQADARTAILRRKVYAALQPRPTPLLLVASAAISTATE